jgi:hypothetical protein
MNTKGGEEMPTSQIMRTSRIGERAADWDAIVRRAFLEGCVHQGVRADMSRLAMSEAREPRAASELRASAEDASRRAALAWLTIETCLEQYGELAALALERCIEEAALQIRRRSYAPSSRIRTTQSAETTVSRSQLDRDDAALAIVERGRERLARFWESSDTSAA